MAVARVLAKYNFDSEFFDKYTTTSYYLSRGASGNVYGPIQWKKTKLAIKQTTFADGKVTDQFKQDLEEKHQIWISLDHEHIMRIHSVYLGQLPKVMSIVMEFAAGGSLNKTLRLLGSENKLPVDVVTGWAKQIAEGMQYLHERNIVHRDLKSSNILLTKTVDSHNLQTTVTLKISDFDEVTELDHTTTMSFVGTCAYMAPEVLKNQWFSKASDAWSYGVVVWEMLSGDIPYKDLGRQAIMSKSIRGELDNLPIEPSFPEDYQQLLKQCWESTHARRPSFNDILCHLQVKATENRDDSGNKQLQDLLKKSEEDRAVLGARQDLIKKSEEDRAVFGAHQDLLKKSEDRAVLDARRDLLKKSEEDRAVLDARRDLLKKFEDRAVLGARLKPILADDEITENEVELRHKIKANPKDHMFYGVAILNENLFVARIESSVLDVYNCNNFKDSKLLRVKGLVSTFDMCSCNINSCLYILDDKGHTFGRKILRINSEGNVLKKWPIKRGRSLSAGMDGNVIMTHPYEDLLLEYSPNGDLLGRIYLTRCPKALHAIKMNNGRYMVSHRDRYKSVHRLCLVDEVGYVEKSFGRGIGSAKDQLNEPLYFAVGNSGYVIVADYDNHRLLLLDSNLEFKTKIVPKYKQKFLHPSKFCLSGTLLVVLIHGGHPDNSTFPEADDSLEETEEGDTSTMNNEMLIEEDCSLLVFDIEPVLQKYFS